MQFNGLHMLNSMKVIPVYYSKCLWNKK